MGRAIPFSDAEFVTWLANLSAKAASTLGALGFVAADYTAITADYTLMQGAVVDQAGKQTAAQSATQAKNATRTAVQKRCQALARRIKGHALYTSAIGEQLGLVAPGAGALASRAGVTADNVRPVLRGMVSGDGVVTIKFTKHGYTGVLIQSRRCGEAEFTPLAKQFRSPLVDDRASQTAGAPEMREYKAQYLRGDTTVGQMSDVVVLTVPATASAPASTSAVTPASAARMAA